jgi:hypothetical protein
MSLKHLAVATMVAICTFVAQDAAQTNEQGGAQRNELSGILGRTFIADQGIQGAPAYDPNLRFGKGLTFEINYARRFMATYVWSLSLEVPFVVNPDVDAHTYANPFLSYRSYFVTPAARVNFFPATAVSPWLSFGGGFGYFGGISDANASKSGNAAGVMQGGVGLDVKLTRRFTVRGEARDFWSGVPDLNVNTGKSHQHNILVGGGLVWHF